MKLPNTHAISIRVSFMLNYSHPDHHLDKMSLGHTVQVKKNQSPDSKVNTFYYQFQNVHIWFSKSEYVETQCSLLLPPFFLGVPLLLPGAL